MDQPRYLLPAAGREISVRRISYGGKSIGYELIEAVALSLLIFILVQSVIQNRKVVGHSMDPTLQNDEHLLIERLSYFRYDGNFFAHLADPAVPMHEQYLLTGPQRGDIVVFRPPVPDAGGSEEDYIKRVIALPGEQVEVRAYDGVYVNGHLLDEPYIQERADYSWPQEGGPREVPADHLFVLGDNRRNSSDSHAWGFLDIHSIVGRAWISYWPRDVWGILVPPSYANH